MQDRKKPRVKDRTRRSRLTRILESEPPCAREEFARRLPIPQLGLGLEPPMTIGVEDRSTIREPLLVSEIFLMPPSIPLVGAPEPPVWEPDQRLFHSPDVSGREPPVRAQGPPLEDATFPGREGGPWRGLAHRTISRA